MSTPQPDTAKIAEAAFYLWLDEGRPQGQDRDHWFRATQALTAAAKPARKPRAKAAAKPAAARAKAAPKTKAAAKPAAARKPRNKAES